MMTDEIEELRSQLAVERNEHAACRDRYQKAQCGGVAFQPVLGRVADTLGYAASYVVSAGISCISFPFLLAARRENVREDRITDDDRFSQRAPPGGRT